MKRTVAPLITGTTIRNRGTMRSLRVKHREYITDINSNGTGSQILTFAVNPGRSPAFPWLSQVANNFETYRFNALMYTFVPTVSASTDGAVAICPDYDAADDDSTHSKGELLTFQDAVRGNVWSTIEMRCTPSNLNKLPQRFTRITTAPSGTDIKTYDALQLKIVVNDDKAAGANLGELWVDYDITLFTPQLDKYSGDDDLGMTIKADTTSLPVSSELYHFINPQYWQSKYGNLESRKHVDFSKTDSANRQFNIIKPGNYLLSFLAKNLNLPGSTVISVDSDTSDCSVQEYSQTSEETATLDVYDYTSIFKVAAGALTSILNPVTVQYDIDTDIEVLTGGFGRLFLDRVAGFTLPTGTNNAKKAGEGYRALAIVRKGEIKQRRARVGAFSIGRAPDERPPKKGPMTGLAPSDY